MNTTIPKKLAVIQDIAGVGRCSLSAALPIISACRVQACPLPTAIFSNHTGYPSFYKKDLTECIPDYLNQWRNLNRHFDGIYCGYLGSLTQMQIISSYLQKEISSSPDTKIIIDPVFGDHGRIYTSLPDGYISLMQDFVRHASLITPNITEACFLTQTLFREESFSLPELTTLGKKLHTLGPSKIIITGIRDGDFFVNFIFDAASGMADICRIPVSGSSRPGTGDIFTSIVAAKLLTGIPLNVCVKTAADFIATCTKASDEAGVPVCDGVIFENFLPLLAVQSDIV